MSNTEISQESEIKFNENTINFFRNRETIEERTLNLHRKGVDIVNRLENFEANRIDYPVTWDTIRTANIVNDKVTLRWNTPSGKVKNFSISRGALNQILNSRANNTLKLSVWDSLAQDYDHYDQKLDLKQIMLDETFKSRTGNFLRYFRETNAFLDSLQKYADDKDRIVVGVVGKNFPRDFSDFTMIKSMGNVLDDIGISYKYGHCKMNDRGGIEFSTYFTDKDFISNFGDSRASDLRNSRGALFDKGNQSSGIFYRNNFSGMGSLGFGLYYMKLICTNGMKIKRLKSLIDNVAHSTASSFYRGIVENIMTFPTDFGERFELSTGLKFDLPIAPPPSYYEKPENLERIYEHIAKSVVFRVLAEQKMLDVKYKESANIVLKDWRNELRAVAEKYELSYKSLEILNTVAVNDPTIKLDPKIGTASHVDIIDIFTSAANYLDSRNSKKAFEFQEIGGNLLYLAKPLTKTLTVENLI